MYSMHDIHANEKLKTTYIAKQTRFDENYSNKKKKNKFMKKQTQQREGESKMGGWKAKNIKIFHSGGQWRIQMSEFSNSQSDFEINRMHTTRDGMVLCLAVITETRKTSIPWFSLLLLLKNQILIDGRYE